MRIIYLKVTDLCFYKQLIFSTSLLLFSRRAAHSASPQQQQHAQLLPQRGGGHLSGSRVLEAQRLLQLCVRGWSHQLFLRVLPSGQLCSACPAQGPVLPLLPRY